MVPSDHWGIVTKAPKHFYLLRQRATVARAAELTPLNVPTRRQSAAERSTVNDWAAAATVFVHGRKMTLMSGIHERITARRPGQRWV
jgi:hypothetical protein